MPLGSWPCAGFVLPRSCVPTDHAPFRNPDRPPLLLRPPSPHPQALPVPVALPRPRNHEPTLAVARLASCPILVRTPFWRTRGIARPPAAPCADLVHAALPRRTGGIAAPCARPSALPSCTEALLNSSFLHAALQPISPGRSACGRTNEGMYAAGPAAARQGTWELQTGTRNCKPAND